MSLLGRLVSIGGFAAAAIIGSASAAFAIDPFDNFTCPGGPLTVPGLTTVPASSADNVNIGDGQRLSILIIGGVSGTITRTDNGTTVIDLFNGITSATIDGPLVVTLNTPDLGGGALFAAVPGGMTITFSCSAIPGANPPPPPPPPPPGVGNDASVIDGALLDNRRMSRISGLFGNMFEIIDRRKDIFCLGAPRGGYELRRRAGVYNQLVRDYYDGVSDVLGGTEDKRLDYIRRLQCEYDTLLAAADDLGIVVDLVVPPTLPQSAADSDIFPLVSPGGATFPFFGNSYGKLQLGGASLTSMQGGVTRQTQIGDLSALWIALTGRDTAIGIGANATGTTSTVNTPAATIDTTTYGLDFFLAGRPPATFGEPPPFDIKYGVYFGLDYGQVFTDFGGLKGTTDTYGASLGATLESFFELDEFDLAPHITALMQGRHRNGFTDSGGNAIAPSDFFILDIKTGAVLSREFVDPETGTSFKPFIGLDGLFNSSTVTPGLAAGTPLPDPFRLGLTAGLDVQFPSGGALGLHGGYTVGPTTSGFNVNLMLHMPLDPVVPPPVTPPRQESLLH